MVGLLGSAWDGELYGGWHLNLEHKLSKRYTRHTLLILALNVERLKDT